MLAVKAYYEDGRIVLVEPVPPNIKKANLIIIIDSEEDSPKNYIRMDGYRISTPDSEEDFQMLGLYNFFDSDDDANIDWEVYFGLK